MSNMSDHNEACISGRLTRNPELRKTPSGVSIVDLSIAANRYTSPDTNGDQKKFTSFIKATAWDKQAEYLNKHVKMGDEVIVWGILEDDNFEQDDGKKTSGRLKVRINEFRIGSKRTKKSEASEPVAE
jgi:single-strand DNA-binding protein